jgi:hypothetical protein
MEIVMASLIGPVKRYFDNNRNKEPAIDLKDE